MSNIKVMDENLANKIAAGEVIERIVNVVKELTENAVDAKATEIKISLIDSGIKEITVVDDGVGMDKEDAILAFSRHATSKIKDLEDLFYVSTLGFRGEALPSIASVSLVNMKTSNGKVGTEIEVDGGKIVKTESCDLKKGTRITVKKLFYNTPVRLKYIKNLYTELAYVTDYVNKMALSYPNIRFVLKNNDKVLLNTDGSGNLLKVISNIYDISLTKKMIYVENSNDDYDIKGYIGYPEIARTSKNSIVTLINGRVIKNYELNRTIKDAYHTYIPESKTPVVVLSVETDPILIDVNVHPTKMDVKFSKMDSLVDLINKTIKSKLETYNLIPEIKSVYKEEKEEEITTEEPSTIEEIKLDLEVHEEPVVYEKTTKKENTKEKDIEVTEVEEPRIKKMYPVGAVDATYIIAENEDGMYIIDQHACAERINFEKYLDKLTNHDNKCVDLLVAIKLELSSSEFIILKENLDKLVDMGFTLEEFGANTFLIRSHPYWLESKHMEESIKSIVDILIENEKFDYERFIWRVAATLACKHSIRAHDVISKKDMEDLLEQIRYTKNPFTCPHGRPTIITYSKYELERMFKRVMN